jgi:hypothetical protein
MFLARFDYGCRFLLRTGSVDRSKRRYEDQRLVSIERTGLPGRLEDQGEGRLSEEECSSEYRCGQVIARKHYTRARCDSLR